MRNMDRRRFFGAVGAGAAGIMAAQRLAQAALVWPISPERETKMARIPIALQLYSVRDDAAKDLPGVLKAVAKMGYEGVEFAGYYGWSGTDLRKLLDDNGLRCAGTHIGLETLQGAEFEKSVEFHKTIGNKFPIVPGLAEEYRSSREAWLKAAEVFNELADKLAPLGMRTGYHNHNIEFQPLGGELPWDTFFGHTKQAVVMQMDTGNAMSGGADPVPFLERYPNRAATVHLKPYSASLAKQDPGAGFRPLIGEDELPWADIFRLCETTGGTEWYIVEYESDKYPPMQAVDLCLQKLKEMGK
jgi:sugar phosphate isomerase/epimerase